MTKLLNHLIYGMSLVVDVIYCLFVCLFVSIIYQCLAEPTDPTSNVCSSEEFTCLDSSCVQLADRCDNKYDCPDGSDEQQCNSAVLF